MTTKSSKLKSGTDQLTAISRDTPVAPLEQIAEVRRLVEENLTQEGTRSLEDIPCEPADLLRLRTSDWFVTRFLLKHEGDLQRTADDIVAAGQWRHSLRICSLKDQDFPELFYRIGEFFQHSRDLHGNTLLICRVAMHHKLGPRWQAAIRLFMLHVINRVDQKTDGRGVAVLFDCSGAGLENFDLDHVTYLIEAFDKYSPKAVNYILNYEMSWLMRNVWRVAQSVFPASVRRLHRYASKKDIHEWVSRDCLPDFMGGTSTIDYRRPPAGCIGLEEWAAQQGVSQEELDRIKKTYQDYLQEDEEAEEMRRSVAAAGRRQSSLAGLWNFVRRRGSMSQINSVSPPGGDRDRLHGQKRSSSVRRQSLVMKPTGRKFEEM